eukprot:424989-Pyramimonas_sp.AAC.1
MHTGPLERFNARRDSGGARWMRAVHEQLRWNVDTGQLERFLFVRTLLTVWLEHLWKRYRREAKIS